MEGYIYALYNSCFRDYGDNSLVKIGMTKNQVKERVDQLNTTGLPEPFKVIYLRKVYDYKKIESHIHQSLKHHRWNSNREFFALPIHQVTTTLDSIIDEYINNHDSDYWFCYGAGHHIDDIDF